MNHKKIISAFVLYFLSTGASYATFAYINRASGIIEPGQVITTDTGLQIDPGEPKTETCPLNGQLFTKTEKNAWDKRLPLAVMIENHPESRPQSGLSTADVVYEAVSEGGVTRFMGLFYCDAVSHDTILAPIRSARTYFLDWASEYGESPIYAHIGGANCSADKDAKGNYVGACKSDKRVQAIEQIASYGWRLQNDIDGMSVGLPVFKRDKNRLGPNKELATEHTVVSSTERLWAEAAKRGLSNQNIQDELWTEAFSPWKFKDAAGEGSRGNVTTVVHDFWSGQKAFDVKWDYDPAGNLYRRTMGGEPHLDLDTQEQIAVTNVIVQFVKEENPVDELKHTYYATIGKGEALIFRDGEVVEANWSKTSRTDRTVFTDKKGQPVEFSRGKIWLSVVDPSTTVSY